MVIDFHAHIFPEAIAARAVEGISRGADILNYTDGTKAGLLAAMDAAEVDIAVLQPVATRPSQITDINNAAAETNLARGRLRSFGGIHPDCENYKEILRSLAKRRVPGVKLHPLFQRVPADDIRYVRIVNEAAQLGLSVLIHAGLDPDFPGEDLADPERLSRLIRQAPGAAVILAHMGGLGQWSRTEALLGWPVYLDTACAISPWRTRAGRLGVPEGIETMSREKFLRFVRVHGAHHVLFGTDSPWSDMGESLKSVRESGLTAQEQELILCKNAKRLLEML